MAGSIKLVGILGTIGGFLSFLIILVGLVLTVVAYLKGKSRVALLGALGFLLMFLFSCCSLGETLGWGKAIARVPRDSVAVLITVRSVVMFIFGLLNLVGLALIIAALWVGGRKEG